jgi:hypothetical protein
MPPGAKCVSVQAQLLRITPTPARGWTVTLTCTGTAQGGSDLICTQITLKTRWMQTGNIMLRSVYINKIKGVIR